ncbi:glycosyl hydrolase family 8 [Pleomorphomonas sp. JP5]|uniref:glycosyl hydrolase family 8 n=1 Tax=Pleomorphomonas sp. JP5 TaxID=2942998 RepID=UPI0020440101|nr:glycosyl hydrolase family 8 [Pleomorphomonas sp. JP5]MCM5558178.1 glycosyl hydrolase family 8 [Pleomorphomonas sp. JP5]
MRKAILVLMLLFPVAAQALPLYPSMPQSERYVALDSFWTEWKRLYLREGCGGAYVATSGDGKTTWGGSASNTLTVSEAHGYGMLALVQMEDRDPDAHRLFDLMQDFFLAHPAVSDPGLMAWNQTRDCRDAPDGGNRSASDGDLDIALALLKADQRWGEYGALAASVRTAVLVREVTPDGMIMLGDWARSDEDGTYAGSSRSSDFMPASFAAFAAVGDRDAKRWSELRDRGYLVWGRLSRQYARKTGLVPDFLTGLPDEPHPVPTNFLEGRFDGAFSWNALRFPWRLALDFLMTGDERAASHLVTINRWIQTVSGGDPMRIATTYRLDGRVPPDQDRGSAAFIAMFAAGAMAGSNNASADQAWLDALWAALLARPAAKEDYYGNTLKLLAMIALCGETPPP